MFLSFMAEIAASLSRLAMTINTVPVITISIYREK